MILIKYRPYSRCGKSSVSISLIDFINIFRRFSVCIHYRPVLKSKEQLASGRRCQHLTSSRHSRSTAFLCQRHCHFLTALCAIPFRTFHQNLKIERMVRNSMTPCSKVSLSLLWLSRTSNPLNGITRFSVPNFTKIGP